MVNAGIGLIAGYIANFLWERYQLFGYGHAIYEISDKPVLGRYIGLDDFLLVVLGVIILVLGRPYIALGFIVIQVVIKLIEMNTPISDSTIPDETIVQEAVINMEDSTGF